MGTFSAKPTDIKQDWLHFDANDCLLGRLAARIATILRGKHKAIFTPHMDTGDFVVVTNVDKLKVTGNKLTDKRYYRHTGFPGGIRERSFRELQDKAPGKALMLAVKGMLPKGPLGAKMISKLKIYAGEQHPHTAQQPKTIQL